MKLPVRRLVPVFYFLFLLPFVGALAKSSPGLIMYWPTQEKPSLKLTFNTFQQVGGYGKKVTLLSDVIVQNVSGKPIPHASFTVYMLDRDKMRVGNGVLVFDDLAPGESAKVQFQCDTVGTPATLALMAHRDAEGIPNATKVVPLKIISVPAGAKLVVDGQDEGITPALVNLTVGTHKVELSKDGFAAASTPVDIKPDEMPGGSITIELGGLSLDTLELRDGTVVTGDVISLSLTEVVGRVDGKDAKYDRNQVKRIMLVERITSEQPAVVQPVDTKEKE
jgi:PEGA domain